MKIWSEPQRVIECKLGRVEQRLPSGIKSESTVRNNAGNGSRHNDFRLELGRAIKDLRGKQCPGQRCAKYGGNARAHPGGHENPPVCRTQVQQVGQYRSKTRPDLRDRAFAAARAACADCQCVATIFTKGTAGEFGLGANDKPRSRRPCRALRPLAQGCIPTARWQARLMPE